MFGKGWVERAKKIWRSYLNHQCNDYDRLMDLDGEALNDIAWAHSVGVDWEKELPSVNLRELMLFERYWEPNGEDRSNTITDYAQPVPGLSFAYKEIILR